MPSILALDFGGTKHSASLIEVPSGLKKWPAGSTSVPGWLRHGRINLPPNADAQADLATMRALAAQILAGNQPAAIGISFGGPVDAAANRVRLSHHVPGWENVPLGEIFIAEYACPVRVDNDANLAALGEFTFGAGRGCQSMMYITVSTGVGGGWVIAGDIWHGNDSMAGEIGHTLVDPHGPYCLCGKRGCVERLASGSYMAQDARLALSEDPQRGPILIRMAGSDPQGINGQMIAEAAALGDPLAQDLLARSAHALGVGIGNAANLINPQRFILGGGVTKAGAKFWQDIRQAAAATALPQVQFEILPAELSDDAPLWGAAALAGKCL